MFKRGSVAVVAAGVVLAVGGCGGGPDEKAGASDKEPAEPARTRPPSAELVAWTGDICESATALKNVRTESAADLKEIRNPDEVGPSAEQLAVGYIARTPLSVVAGARPEGPRRVGCARCRPHARRLAEEAAQGRVRAREGVPVRCLRRRRGQCRGRRRTRPVLTPPKPDLPALTRRTRSSRPRTSAQSNAPRAGSPQPRRPHLRPAPPARCRRPRTARTPAPARRVSARSW